MKTLFKFSRVAALLAAALLVAPLAEAQIANGVNSPNPINSADNGNFNIAQRGTATVNTITTTATYLWDRWAGYSGAATNESLVNVTSGLPGQFTAAAQVQRASGQTGVKPVCLIQEVPTLDTEAFQGQPVTVSFWALSGSNFSAAGNLLNVQVATGTGTDQGLASFIAGWTGAATPLNANQAITANWQRYAWTTNPTVVAATATEMAVQFCFTPVGTAGTNDYFQITGVQLERGTVASNFEWVPNGQELAKVERYAYVINEGVRASAPVGYCTTFALSGASGHCYIPLPVPMRVAPTVTITTGTFSFDSTTLSAWGTPANAAAGSNSPTQLLITTTGVGPMENIGGTTALIGAGGTGVITASADF